MMPTDVLREEHRVILRALVVLEAGAERLAVGDALPEGWWENLIRWFRSFADANHHAKEERYLFPALAKVGVPSEGGPLAVMLEEHGESRDLVQAMERDAAGRVGAARRYVRLLRDHIEKENGVLFPLAETVLHKPEWDVLAGEFESVQAEQGREASIDHAEVAVARLETALG